MNTAVREDIISENPINKLSVQDKIKVPESKREFLTIDELKKLKKRKIPINISNRLFCSLAIAV